MAKTVLIVDDSRVARMILKKLISESASDWTIEEVGGAAEALTYFEEKTADAAILDFHMPGIDGLELAGILRSSNSDLPMIMLTANIQKEIEERAAELGVGFLTKPVDKDKLVAFLNG